MTIEFLIIFEYIIQTGIRMKIHTSQFVLVVCPRGR